jgi:hypothetical protein
MNASDQLGIIQTQKKCVQLEIKRIKQSLEEKLNEFKELSRKEQIIKQKTSDSPLKLKQLLHKERELPKRESFKMVQRYDADSVQSFTNLRMYQTVVSNDDFDKLSKDRQLIKMDKLITSMVENDIKGDWITIGVLYSIIKVKSKEDDGFYCLSFTDLKNAGCRLFLEEKVYRGLNGIAVQGSVVALLNCQIIIPSEV